MNAIHDVAAHAAPGETTFSGLPFVGELSWGEHFCHFFETAKDLEDCLVPFFKAGLENNEKCLWVTSAPFEVADAVKALRAAVPDCDAAIARGQIEILGHREWYLKVGTSNPDELTKLWISRVDAALAEGYKGLRVTGNTAFLEPADWDDFMHYEDAVHRAFHGRRIIALCSYPMRLAQFDSVLDVISRHGFAVARRNGRWETVESAALAAAKKQLAALNRDLEARVAERTAHLERALAEQKRAEQALAERERHSRELLDSLPAAVYTTDPAGRIAYYNDAAVALWGRRPELRKAEWCGAWKLFWPDGTPLPHDQCPMAMAIKENRTVRGMEAIAERPDGTRVAFIPYPTPLRDAQGRMIGAVNMMVDITERKQAEDRLQLLMREVDHRAKNMLATVHAIVRMTRADGVPDYIDALTGRLQTLARAHTLLADNRWTGASLTRVVKEEMAPYATAGGRRVTIAGPEIDLGSDAAQALAMATHELATNAAKYGALSTPGGRVDIAWGWSGDTFTLRWTERGGPSAREPGRSGFGMRLIERTLRDQLDGEARLEWRPEGLVCELDIGRERLLGEPAAA